MLLPAADDVCVLWVCVFFSSLYVSKKNILFLLPAADAVCVSIFFSSRSLYFFTAFSLLFFSRLLRDDARAWLACDHTDT